MSCISRLILVVALLLGFSALTGAADKSEGIPSDPAQRTLCRQSAWAMVGAMEFESGAYVRAQCEMQYSVSSFPPIVRVCKNPTAEAIEALRKSCWSGLQACMRNAFKQKSNDALDGCFGNLDQCSRRTKQ